MTTTVPLGTSGLQVPPLCLGGNVFGWTADEQQSFAVLDAFVEAGGTFIDTADVYSAWVPGHVGGESERVLGRWMAARGNRDDLVLATKVASGPGREGLDGSNVRLAAQESLVRLQTDRIDLYYAHRDDETTPQEDTCAAFDALVQEGSVRALGASNFSAGRLASALAVQDREGWARYSVVQPLYNLLEREYETELAPLVAREGLACVPYAALAGGFLSGKYRSGADVDSPRAPKAARYLERGGEAALTALQAVADARGTSIPAVAVAWVRQQPTVVAPIASGRTAEQLGALLPGRDLVLTADELADLGRDR